MKTPKICSYKYSAELIAATEKVAENVVDGHQQRAGMAVAEPLTILIDSLLKYAQKHKERYGDSLSADYVLGPAWLRNIEAAHELLDGEGLFSNGILEDLYWKAKEIAGFSDESA